MISLERNQKERFLLHVYKYLIEFGGLVKNLAGCLSAAPPKKIQSIATTPSNKKPTSIDAFTNHKQPSLQPES